MHRSAAGSVFISIAQAAKGEWSLFFQILHHTVQFLLHFLVTADVEFRQLLGTALEAADAYRLIGADNADASLVFQRIDLVQQSVVAHLLGQQRGQEQRFIAIKIIIQVHHALAGLLFSETFLPRGHDDDLVKALAQRPVDGDGAGAAAVQVAVTVDLDRKSNFTVLGLSVLREEKKLKVQT